MFFPVRNYSAKGYVPVITRKEVCKVNTKDIFYIEKELRRINIFTLKRTYTFYGKLNDIINYLGDNFYKCHSSCIINMDKIIKMENGIFYLENGQTLRVGQNSYQGARRYYQSYLASK